MAYQEFSESAEAKATESVVMPTLTMPRSLGNLFSGGRGLLIGLGLGLAIAFVGFRLIPSGQGKAEQSPTSETIAAQSVSISPTQTATINQTLNATGTVQAYDLLAVAPQISGLQIRSVLVREGDRVSAGQPLAVLDDATLQTQIRQAEAEIAAAQAQVRQQQASLAQSEASRNEADANLNRYNTLAERGAVSQEELASRTTQAVTARESVGVAQANVDSARANVNSERANLARLQTQLKSNCGAPPPQPVLSQSATRPKGMPHQPLMHSSSSSGATS